MEVSMKTILVDDECIVLKQLRREIEEDICIDLIGSFTLPSKALEFAKDHKIDFAVLDIGMPGIGGMEFGKKLRNLCPGIVLIYVTGYREYMKDTGFEVKAYFYVMTPYSHEKIEDMIQRAVLMSGRSMKRVKFRTFGRFDVFIDGNLIHFSNAKAKELLARCVDHEGGNVHMEEAVDKLWENRRYDEKTKNLYRKAVSYCHRLLEQYGCGEVFVSERGSCHIDKKRVECDYFQYLRDRSVRFEDEYMIDYEWARVTEARLVMAEMEAQFKHGRADLMTKVDQEI